jgi:hypothetical protein
MKILKVEDHNYKIIYINDNGHYNVYRRLSETDWSVFSIRRNKWVKVEDVTDLEKSFKNE